uniref:Uncharacterized protein n=1 Tax=Arcella intermedia TaxID=1963864 RepID=A0A6B2L9E8_9EUKA
MGCIASTTAKELPLQTQQNTIRILCLGLGGCGKTTFVKQLKIINRVPWGEAELQAFTKAIKSNYIKGLQDAYEVLGDLGLEIKAENKPLFEELESLRPTTDLTPEVVDTLKKIYEDPSIQTIINHHIEQITVTHIAYFFHHIDRILSPTYLPTDEDILRARVRTSGAHSSTIFIDKSYFEFHDVGGQRPDRAKWEAVLKENVFAAVIYFVAADEYGVESEDKEGLKLEISRGLFAQLRESIPQDQPIVLFMNRMDLFEKRIADQKGFGTFQKIFPDFKGEQKKDKTSEYVKEWFLSDVKGTNVKHHYTCAMDRESLVIVWRIVKESFLNGTFKELGF